MEYRALGDEHKEAYYEFTRYAFSPTSGPEAYDPDEHDIARMDLADRRGLFDDGELRSVCAHHWFDANIRGTFHAAPGLSAVATPPEHRRSGYVTKLMRNALEEYRDRGDIVSLLWPFRYRFYRQMGWESCADGIRYSCEPSALAFARDEREQQGAFRQLDADDFDQISPVYEHYVSEYTLSVTRSDEWWRYRVFESWRTDPYVYAWEVDGEVRAYLTYVIDGESGERTLQVYDLAYLDLEGLLAILAFLTNHDSQVTTVSWSLPTDVAVLDLASDPEEIEATLKTGAMARLVDITRSLPALCEPEVDAQVTIEVSDPLVDWNDGTFHLEVADGEATCEQRMHDPDARIDIAHLTQLAVGHRSARHLADLHRLDAAGSVIDTLDELFPRAQTYLGTGF